MRRRFLLGHGTIVWQRGKERVVLRHHNAAPAEEPGAGPSTLWVETLSDDDVDAMGVQRWHALGVDGDGDNVRREAILARAMESLVAQVRRMSRPTEGPAEAGDMEDAVRDARRSPEAHTPPPEVHSQGFVRAYGPTRCTWRSQGSYGARCRWQVGHPAHPNGTDGHAPELDDVTTEAPEDLPF